MYNSFVCNSRLSDFGTLANFLNTRQNFLYVFVLFGLCIYYAHARKLVIAFRHLKDAVYGISSPLFIYCWLSRLYLIVSILSLTPLTKHRFYLITVEDTMWAVINFECHLKVFPITTHYGVSRMPLQTY